ncbi:MAG: hypothetical protein ACLRFG_01520 [Clostridia bacterium]
MFKRIMKIVGFAFLGVVGVFGVIAGVMAIRGDFNTEVIKPKSLYFSGDEEYFADNTLLISTDSSSPKSFYFQVKAGNEDANVLGVNFTIEGEDVIDIVHSVTSLPIRSGKIGSNIKIIPRVSNGVNVGGIAKISATSADGLVPTTTDLTVYVDVPVTEIKTSASCVDTTNLTNIKTKTRDDGVVLTKKYYYQSAQNHFELATKIKHDAEYYLYNSTTKVYATVTPANTDGYINFVDCFEDAHIVTMLNGQELAIESLYTINPAHSANPINAGGYSTKQVQYFILNAEDRALVNFDQTGKKLIANNNGATGDIRLLMAMYPTYTKQKQAEALIASGALIRNSNDHFNNYMVTREVVVRVDATSIDSMTASRQSLSLDLYNYTDLMLNNATANNNLGLVIKDTAQNPINTLYSHLNFEFVSSTDDSQVSVNDYFTITDNNAGDIPDTYNNVNMSTLTGDTQLYIYAKMYIPRAYLKVSYMSGETSILDLYIELLTTFREPSIATQAGTSRIDKLIDLDLGLDDESNIVDLSSLFTLTTDSVYDKVLYFASVVTDKTGYVPVEDDLPISTLPGKTYGSTGFLIGYYDYTPATTFDAEGEYFIYYNEEYIPVQDPISDNLNLYYTRTLVLDKAKTRFTKVNGTFSVMAVVVRTNYLGQIVDYSKVGESVYGDELDLSSTTDYDFNYTYPATGEKSAMTASAYQKTFTWNYRLQNVCINLSASIEGNNVGTDTKAGEYRAPVYKKSTIFNNATQYFINVDGQYLAVAEPKSSDIANYYEIDANSQIYYLRELFDSNRTALLSLEITDAYAYKALQHIVDSKTYSLVAKMYNADGTDYVYALGDNISNYITIGGINNADGKFVFPVSLLKATPADTYISFVLSVSNYATTFPNDSSVYSLDRLVILSSAVSSIDILDEGVSILAGNSQTNPLVVSAKWNDTGYDYYIGSKKVENSTDFFNTAYTVDIQPNYATTKAYTYYSSNTSIISITDNKLTLGTQEGSTILTISCGDCERRVYISLVSDAQNPASIEINNINTTIVSPFGGAGYEDLPALKTVQLTDNTNTSRVNYKVNSYSANNLLTFSDPVVYNESGVDITSSCVGKFVIPENDNEFGRYLAIDGALTSHYYLVIKVTGPFAQERELKLYLHSAVTVAYNDYGTHSVGSTSIQEVYDGTNFQLLSASESKETFTSPVFVHIQDESKLLGGENGIASIAYALNDSYTATFNYIEDNTRKYTTTSTDTAYQISITNAMVGKYLQFKIVFKNNIATPVYYTVYVSQNLHVVTKDATITSGSMIVYSGRDYAIADLLELYSYPEAIYTHYTTSDATKIDLTDIGNINLLTIAKDKGDANSVITFDLGVISVEWLDSNISDDRATIIYKGIEILTITAQNPVVLVQTDSADIKGMSVTSYNTLGTSLGIKALVKTADTAITDGKTYYTADGDVVASPMASQLGLYYEEYVDFAYSDMIISLGTNTANWNDDNVIITDVDGEYYIFVNTNPSTTTALNLNVRFDVEGVAVYKAITLNVVTNLPTDFIKANNTATAGDVVDLRDYINTSYDISIINDYGEVEHKTGTISLSEDMPFVSVDGSIAILDKYFITVPEPNNGTNSRELTFTITTSFGYTTNFVVVAKSATSITLNYPTTSMANGHGYEQVVAGQTIHLTTIDSALDGYLRAYADKKGTRLPLTISYSYDPARDNFDATSIVSIDNANGTVTFSASASNMFAVTLTESNSGMQEYYYFYITQDSGLDFETQNNGQTLAIDKDNLNFDVKNVAKVMDGLDEYIGTGRNTITYGIVSTTDDQATIDNGVLTFKESNQDHDYIIAVYNEFYFFGTYHIHTTPNIVVDKESITAIANGEVIDTDEMPTFTYNGAEVTISNIGASAEVADYLTIMGSNITTKYVPSQKNGTLTFTLSMQDALGTSIGDYEYSMPITLTLGEYFAKNATSGLVEYSTSVTALEIVGDGETSKLSLKQGEGLWNEVDQAYANNYLLIDTDITYDVKTINSNNYTNQDLSQYFDEQDNVFTFAKVPADVRLKLVITTAFGYQVDLYVTILADISNAVYLGATGTEGSLSNPYNLTAFNYVEVTEVASNPSEAGYYVKSGNNYVLTQDTEDTGAVYYAKEYHFNRSIDLAEVLSITNYSGDTEYLVPDNFTISAEDVTADSWLNVAPSEYFDLTETTLTIANTARDLSLKLVIHIHFNADGSQVYSKNAVLYLNISANYTAFTQYAYSTNNYEYVQTGDLIEINDAENYLLNRQSAESGDSINAERMVFATIDGLQEIPYSTISDETINAQSKMSLQVVSASSNSVTAMTTSIGGKTYLVFSNPTNDVHTITIRYTNNAGLSGDLAMLVVYRVYPENTLDGIKSIKYNGSAKSDTNTHQLLQENALTLSLDFVLTTFGSETSNIVFSYLSAEKGAFIESFRAVVIKDGEESTDFIVTINENGVVLEMNDDLGVDYFTIPQMYSILFYSRVGYLGQYDFSYTQDVIIAPISAEDYDNYLLGSQQNLRLTDKLSISLASYATGERVVTDISTSIASNAGYTANGGVYSMKLSSTSNLVQINTSGSTNDLYSLSAVGQNTTATIVVDIYYDEMRIATYEYDIVIQDHLKISLGTYQADKDIRVAYMYLGDYYDLYTADDRESVDIDLRADNADGIYFTLYNLSPRYQGYASASDLQFSIDYTNSSSDISSIVSLENGVLSFTKDVTTSRTLVLLVNHAGTGVQHSYTIYIQPSVVFSTYSDGNSSPYVYERVDKSAIYSLTDFNIATTGQTRIIDNVPLASATNPMLIYKQMKYINPTKPEAASYCGVVSGEVAGREEYGANVTMSYAVFDTTEALINPNTGYTATTYSPLTLSNDTTGDSIFTIKVPNVAGIKIMSVKTTINLLGGVEMINYYFIRIEQSITISYQDGETDRTYTFDSLEDGASAGAQQVLFTDTADTSPLFWTSSEGKDFDEVMDKLRFAISGLDNGFDSNEFDLSDLHITIGYPQVDDGEGGLTDDRTKVVFTIATSSDITHWLKNQLSFKLHILAEDSNGLWGLGDDNNLAFITSADDISLASSKAIFNADIIIKPTHALDILTPNFETAPTIDTQAQLGLKEDYTLDFMVMSEDPSTKLDTILDKYARTAVVEYEHNELIANEDAHWSIHTVKATLTGNNYILEQTFYYLVTDNDTFVKVDYSTFNYYLMFGQRIENGAFINNVKDLKANVSLVQVSIPYGESMNAVTPVNRNETYTFDMEDSYYATSNLNGLTIYTFDTTTRTYAEYTGEIDVSGTYYAKDASGVYYRLYNLTTAGLYEYDEESETYIATEDSEFVADKVYYANLANKLTTDGVFTLPYEAWDQARTTAYTISVTADDGTTTYLNEINLWV